MTYNPLIIIPGPGHSTLTIEDCNGKQIKRAWPLELDQKSILNDMKSSLMKMMLFRKDNGFSDKVAQIVKELTEPLSLNPDGTKKHNVKAVKINSSYADCDSSEKSVINKAFPAMSITKRIGEENVFFFSYDMFGDIYDVVQELDKFIGEVKSAVNAEKVDLLCVSLGGTVLKAYLDVYAKKNDIEKVINAASLMCGASLIADIFENNLTLNEPAKLLSLLGSKGESLSSMTGMLPEDVIENTIKKSLEVLRKNLILNCTMMWACIPNDRFDSIYSSFITKGSELDKKVSRLHNYSLNLKEELTTLSASGMKFYQICGYGKNLLPITSEAAVSSDTVVDTELASLGALCSSADVKPDASSCIFSETTWFFNGLEHFAVQNNDIIWQLIAEILSGNSNINMLKYPQFNGSRDIKNLRWNLIPKAKKTAETADGDLKNELENCISQFNSILRNTVIENDNDVKELERKLTELLKND